MHLILNWHPEEKDGLTREEMMRAANGAIRALKADDRQALFAAHNDTEHPHVHIVLNRVSPEDGRILPSKNEKLRLSRWAQKYEEERGKIYCEERVANNAARKRGEYTRGMKNDARHIHELKAANQNNPDIEQIRKKQTKLDANLAKQTREREARRGKAWTTLYEARKKSLQAIQDKKKRDQGRVKQNVREDFRPQWLDLHKDHREKLTAFDAREKTLAGKLQNIIDGVDLKAIFKGSDRKKAISDAYGQLASAGKRREEFLAKQKTEEQRLERQQKAAEQARRQEIHRQSQQKIAERRTLFLAERSTLNFKHDMEDVKNRNEWKKRNEERRMSATGCNNRSPRPGRHSPATWAARNWSVWR